MGVTLGLSGGGMFQQAKALRQEKGQHPGWTEEWAREGRGIVRG